MAQKAVLSLLLSFGLSLNQLFSGAQILKMTHPQMAETIAPIIKDNKELQDVTSAAAESRVEGGSPARAAAESVKGPDALIQSRSQFLKQVEGLVQNPSRLTPETKQKLFQDFAELFQSPKEDLDKYKKNILAIYECQLLFLEDALEAYKQQKEFKSTKRSECER